MYKEIKSYEDLLNAIKKFNKKQLKMPVQLTNSHCIEDHVYELLPALAIGTVDGIDLKYVRSSVDNKRNGNEIFIITDSNPFAEDGAIAHEMGKNFDDMKPIYPKNYSKEMNWTGPAQKLLKNKKKKNNKLLKSILTHRIKK